MNCDPLWSRCPGICPRDNIGEATLTKAVTATTDTNSEDKVNFFGMVTAAIHADLVMNPDKDVHKRQATAAECIEKWVERCLKARRRDERLAWYVANMIAVAMVNGYDWLTSTIASE